MEKENLNIRKAQPEDKKYSYIISQAYFDSAKERGIGIAIRKPSYLEEKIEKGNAVIAFSGEELAGFCYIEEYEEKEYVVNSGLIIFPDFRGYGLAKKIKNFTFNLTREKFPESKIFSITTSDAVMKMNSELGYRPVSYDRLTSDDDFWKGCSSCPNYDVLEARKRKICFCTAMLYNPREEK